MQKMMDYLSRNWEHFVIPLLVLLIVFGAAVVVRRILFGSLRKWAGRTPGTFDNMLVDSLETPFLVWSLMFAIHVSLQVSVLPSRTVSLAATVLQLLWIVSLTMVMSRLAAEVVRAYSSRVEGAQPVTSLTQNLVRLFVVSIGALLMMQQLGVSITPILTALGVGGLAVALALQDTLSNLFAGFYITLAGQIRLGDYIKLNSGEEGYVADISWRATLIRMLSNNMILVPNAKLAQAIVTNYSLPEGRMSLPIAIGVSYDCDIDHVERVLLEEALAGAKEIPGMLSDPPPAVRFIPGFGDSSLNFTLGCQVATFVDQYLVQHEMRKRIFKRFRKEGIEIPFPVRTVIMKS
ncbi:MAG: mechanosensitive ion channel family protein [Acidobacteria bacterium]|nr:mechanosensitive ion channel family protein [Acidobacteriota bacterium]